MYSTPVTTIASIGAANTPIPVLIESDTEPTVRPNGNPLQPGDVWYDKLKEYESIYVLSNNLDITGWQVVGGENYIKELAATISPNVLDLPIATTESVGVVKIGTGLSVSTTGELSVDPNETFQTLQVNGISTLHTVITGADDNGVAINASAGEITAQWLNIGKNPTTSSTDPNYNVSLRTSGDILTYNVNAVALNLASSITTPNAIITNLNGPRAGVVYKLVAGDGLTFEGQASTHIGGTVGNDYNTNVGTIGLNATVLRTTGDQVIVGDLTVNKGVGPNTTNACVVRSVQLQLSENYTDTTAAGDPSLGYIANINGQPYWANGATWQSMIASGSSYTLPIASANLLGGIKIGSGLTIDATTGICDAADAVLLDGGGEIVSGNVILSDGYVRADRSLASDACFEARTGNTLKLKIMANGGIAIGGTIDESATQNSAQVSIRATGSCDFKGKVSVNKLAFLSNFADASSAGSPDLGLIAMIGGAPYFGNGTQWMAIQLGSGLNLE